MSAHSSSQSTPPLETFLTLFKKRWTPLILLALAPDQQDAASPFPRLRRKEIKGKLPQISERILTDALRDLECKQLIERRVLSIVPQGVEYWLTPSGLVFIEPFRALETWCEAHWRDLESL